jgi:uncharacterized protein
MISLVTKHVDELNKICAQHRVKSLELVGSAVTETQFHDNGSDLDFLVEFLSLAPGTYADAYFGLLEAMENLFQRHVDLIMIRAVKNPYFLEAINQNRRLLYAA